MKSAKSCSLFEKTEKMKYKTIFTNKSLKISILLFIICFPSVEQSSVFSQISVNSYIEAGSNVVSQGVYGNFSAELIGRTGTLSASTGALLSFSNATDQIFSAYSLQVANDFKFGNLPVTLNALFLWKPISNEMRETNFGIMAEYRAKHFGYKLGLNTRTYSFTQAAISRYNFADSVHTSLLEPINVMYRLSYFTPISTKLNFEGSITNYDRYFIQQETNPMILLNLTYNFKPNMQFYSELGYMQAGLLNIHVNYFGTYLRGGVVWKID